MSSGTESDESGDEGNVGTNGFGEGAVTFGGGAAFAGAAAGAGEMAKVVEENSRKREKEKSAACFIFQLLSEAYRWL